MQSAWHLPSPPLSVLPYGAINMTSTAATAKVECGLDGRLRLLLGSVVSDLWYRDETLCMCVCVWVSVRLAVVSYLDSWASQQPPELPVTWSPDCTHTQATPATSNFDRFNISNKAHTAGKLFYFILKDKFTIFQVWKQNSRLLLSLISALKRSLSNTIPMYNIHSPCSL